MGVFEGVPIRYVECPRDAWQGLSRFIPTAEKVGFLRKLLDAGFRHLDLTSFVSPKAVPQHRDAASVLAALPKPEGRTYLAIVANEKGAIRALSAKNLTAVGVPFAISETFERRNVGRSLRESWVTLKRILDLTRGRMDLVVYVSMGFGNPYGDPWSEEQLVAFVARLREYGARAIAVADTYGVADADRIFTALSRLVRAFGAEGLGAHLHSRPDPVEVRAKVDAVLSAGVRWIEGALGGVGGCPFAGDDLVGNLPTEVVVPYLVDRGFDPGPDLLRLDELAEAALLIKARYA